MHLQTQAFLSFPPDSNSQWLRQEEEPVIPLSELWKKGPRVHVLLETNHHSSFPEGLDLVRGSNYCFTTDKFISMTNGELLHGPATRHELLTQHQSQENKVIWLFMHSDKLQKRLVNNMQLCHIKYMNIYLNRTGVLLGNVQSQTTNQRAEPGRLSGWCSVAVNSSRNEPKTFRLEEETQVWEQLIGWRSKEKKWRLSRCDDSCISGHQLFVSLTSFSWTYNKLFLHPDPKLPLCVCCVTHLV